MRTAQGHELANPILSSGFEVAFWGVAICIVALSVVTVVSIARRSEVMDRSVAGAWTIAAILLPIAAPVAWFAIGRLARRRIDSSERHAS